MNPLHRKEILKNKLIQQQCTKEELQELYFLLDKYGTEEEREALMKEAWKAGAEVTQDKEKTQLLLQNIKRKIADKNPKPKSNLNFRFMFKVAATVSLIAVLGWLLLDDFFSRPERVKEIASITKATKKGQRRVVTLSDGTVITLNAESSVTFPQTFSDSIRTVSLEGEAFFEVATMPDKPFVVESAGLVTRVLGTSFNINTFVENSIDVTVASGKVMVYPKDSSLSPAPTDTTGSLSKILMPRQQASFNPAEKSFKISEVDLVPYLAWKSHSLYFEMVPFKEVVKVLERWYNVDITMKNDAADLCLIRADYHTRENLENVLEGLKLLVEFDYSFDTPQKLTITAKGCYN